MRKILMTGATGALGRTLLPLLLAKGYKVVCLVRALSRAEAHIRVTELVGNNSNVRVMRGDITEPRCGISDIDREQLMGRVDILLHCAASISFGDKAETYKANVDGVRNVLNVADLLEIKHVTHVSTAYVAGDGDVLSEYDFPSPIKYRPRNFYEETKQMGEAMVRSWALTEDDRRLTILRPSILIGCEDGTSPTFDAYYGYFKPIHRIAEAMRERARSGKELPDGIAVDGNTNTVDLPLVLHAAEHTTLDLVPINWAAIMMTELIGVPQGDDTFHITNPKPPLVRWIIQASLAYLRVHGCHVVSTEREKEDLVARQSKLVQELQRQVDKTLGMYVPYTTHTTEFSTERTRKVLGGLYREPRMLDEAYIGQLLEYAKRTSWGRKTW